MSEIKFRYDISNNLVSGDSLLLIEATGLSKGYISQMLNGRKEMTPEVQQAAELLAAINLWQTRFCKIEASVIDKRAALLAFVNGSRMLETLKNNTK